MDSEWPEYVMLRDTKLHDDMGGLGQRIFTTAGAGYEKKKYIRADLAAPPPPAEQASGEFDEWFDAAYEKANGYVSSGDPVFWRAMQDAKSWARAAWEAAHYRKTP